MTDGASGLGGFTSIPEIVRMVQSGDASRWQEGVTTAEDLSRDHAVVSDRGRRALTDLESAWTGGGAEAAHARIGPAVEATFQASSSYQDNARALSDMSHAFEWLKSSLEPMPEQPPTRGFWDHVTPWDTDTEAEINRYAELEEHNRRVYETYAEHTRSAAERVTNDYGWIDEWDSDIALRRTGEGHEQVATEVRTLVDRRDTTETSGRDSRDSSADSDASTAKQRDAGDSRTGTERDEPGLVHPSGPRDPSPVSVHSGESAPRDPGASDRTSSSGYRAPTDPATYRPVAQQPSNVAVPGSPPGGPGTPNPWSVGGSVGGTPVGGYAGSSAGGSTGAGGVRSGGVSPGGVGSGGGKPGVGAAAGSA
ncbi:hypothetical protein SZMC14600_10793, partial [Saccharomonospora azurea SZMC 14600]|uniref:hypothetical protein n=1 Tax=Saccharomonospora azurea TaxID=40988 RepID=UPI0002400DA6